MYDQTTICKKCQSSRSPDLKTPCAECGARFTPFGYLYEHEIKDYLRGATIIAIFLCLACVAGTVFLALQSTLLLN